MGAPHPIPKGRGLPDVIWIDVCEQLLLPIYDLCIYVFSNVDI